MKKVILEKKEKVAQILVLETLNQAIQKQQQRYSMIKSHLVEKKAIYTIDQAK